MKEHDHKWSHKRMCWLCDHDGKANREQLGCSYHEQGAAGGCDFVLCDIHGIWNRGDYWAIVKRKPKSLFEGIRGNHGATG